MLGFPGSSVGKESTCNSGDPRSIPGLGRCPGEGKGYPLQYSGLENSMDFIVHGVAKSWTRLSNFHLTSLFHPKVRTASYSMSPKSPLIFVYSLYLIQSIWKIKEKEPTSALHAWALKCLSASNIYFWASLAILSLSHLC